MRDLLERFVISSTPAWRVLLAVFASAPFYLVMLIGQGMAMASPAIRPGLNLGAMWVLQVATTLALLVGVGVGVWLWPRRQLLDPVPRCVSLICMTIGLSFTVVTIMAGIFTAGTNVVLLGVLAIGLLLFDRKPVLIAYAATVTVLSAHDLGAVAGLWAYAPALTDKVIQGRDPVWWLALWRQFVFIAGSTVLLGLLLLLFDRLDELNATLRRLSYADGLTGLANRRRAMEVLHNEVARQARTGEPLSLVLIDADHFKQVNDRHGHDMGDTVLRTLGNLLMACVRSPTDVACRLGGEEFALILPDTRREQVRVVCERLREQLSRQAFGHGDDAFRVTLSMGVVESTGLDVEALLHQADHQLYRAKTLGRDRICVAGDDGGHRA